MGRPLSQSPGQESRRVAHSRNSMQRVGAPLGVMPPMVSPRAMMSPPGGRVTPSAVGQAMGLLRACLSAVRVIRRERKRDRFHLCGPGRLRGSVTPRAHPRQVDRVACKGVLGVRGSGRDRGIGSRRERRNVLCAAGLWRGGRNRRSLLALLWRPFGSGGRCRVGPGLRWPLPLRSPGVPRGRSPGRLLPAFHKRRDDGSILAGGRSLWIAPLRDLWLLTGAHALARRRRRCKDALPRGRSRGRGRTHANPHGTPAALENGFPMVDRQHPPHLDTVAYRHDSKMSVYTEHAAGAIS